MGLKLALAGLLAASSAVLGHPGPEDIPLLPIERSDLNHCKREFSAPDFVKRTVDSHMDEFDRLRRELGLPPTKRYGVSTWLLAGREAETCSHGLCGHPGGLREGGKVCP